MAIKRPGAEQPQQAQGITIKRVTSQRSDDKEFVTKEDLLNKLVAVKVNDYDPQHVGQYGTTQKIVVDITDIDNDGHLYPGMWFFSNLAKQIGDGLKPGELGVGRIVSGRTKSGTGTWWGFQFSDDDADYEAAEKALESSNVPY